MTDFTLTATAICKRYGSVDVLDDVSLDIRGGEIHALLGANGAGKSTLCKIMAGLIPASRGTMSLAGQSFAPANKQAAEAAGVQIVQQELNLIPSLSIAENLLFSQLPQRFGVINRRQLHQRARVTLDRLGLSDLETHWLVESLGVGRQQMVEIAAALDQQCQVLILDEPTAALSGRETERLFDQLQQLRRQGVAIIYISHRLGEVSRIADRVTVLRDGRHVVTRDVNELSTDQMVDLMGGENVETRAHRFRSYATDQVAFQAHGFSRSPMVDDVSLTVHRGERLGIAGLVGSGRTELLRLLFGADAATAGKIDLPDESARRFCHPHAAVRAGFAMVTEDRKQNGLLLSQSVQHNASLSALAARFSRCGLIRETAERREASEIVERLEIRCTGINQTVGTLSGGNQQKVSISKWLMRNAKIFLFDEPTRGIDVASRRRIYQLFDTLAQDGKALVIVSSDLEELLETCDRIVVMSAGRLVAAFHRETWSTEKIMQAAFSGYLTGAIA